MANPIKTRLIQNIVLILLIATLALFLLSQKKVSNNHQSSVTLYDKSMGEEVIEITLHVKDREDVLIKNINDIWTVVAPIEFKADKEKIQHLFTILSENAENSYDLNDKDLTKYGLDEDRLSISFNQVKLIFGKYNPVSQKRYIQKGDRMYLISETITGLMNIGVDAFKITEASNNK